MTRKRKEMEEKRMEKKEKRRKRKLEKLEKGTETLEVAAPEEAVVSLGPAAAGVARALECR